MKKCKKGIAFVLSCLILLSPLGTWVMPAKAATVIYSENFDSYNANEVPANRGLATVTVIENPDKKLFTRVEKDGSDGNLHVYSATGGQSGGPRMNVQFDASEMKRIKVTFMGKGDGHGACLNFAVGSDTKQMVNMTSTDWTQITCTIDLEAFTYSFSYGGTSKSGQSLEYFDASTNLTGAQIRFSSATVNPGTGAYFDDIVVEAVYKSDVPEPPFVPTQTPSKVSVPSGARAFLSTDFEDAYATKVSSTGYFAVATENALLTDAGDNRTMLYWVEEGAAATPYTGFSLLTNVNTYEFDAMVMMNAGANLGFGTYTKSAARGTSTPITTATSGYTANAWNKVHVSLNLSTKKMTVSLNDRTLETVSLTYSSSERRALYFYITASVDEQKAVYMDNVNFYTTENYSAILNGVNNQVDFSKVKPQTALNANSFVNNLKDHPRLFVRDWDEMKAKVSANAQAQKWYANVKATADEALTSKMAIYSINDRGNVLESARKARNRIMSLAFIYKMTGEKKYLDRAYEEMIEYGKWPDWSGFNATLVTAEILQGYAYCYDWLYYDLTAAQRLEIENIVKKHALVDYVHNYEGVQTNTNFTTTSINWNPVCNATAIAWALASADDSPQIAEYILEKAPPLIQSALPPYSPEGAYPEGVSYWDYGTSFLIFACDFLENAFTDGFTLPDSYVYWKAPGFAQTADYAIHFDGPAGRFNYGDCSKGHTSSVIMYWLANRFNKPYYAWWQDNRQAVTGSYLGGYDAIAAIAWYDPDNAYNVPGAFTLDKFYTGENAFNGAAMRSSWDESTALYAAMQGGRNADNHQHLSLGTYIVDYMGERFIRVMDYYSYAVKGDKKDFYFKRAESYNTLVINPSAAADQKTNAVARVTDSYSGNGTAYAKLDLTDINADFASYTRGLLLTEGRSRVIVQDEAVATKPSEFYWFANTDADIAIAADGKSAVLTMGKYKMLARIIEGPAEAKFDVMERKSLIEGVDNVGIGAGEKLFIHIENTTTLNLAVEYVPLTSDQTPAAWSCKAMDNWEDYQAKPSQTTLAEQDGKLVFNTKIYDMPQDAIITVALYDKQNKLIATKMQKCAGTEVTHTFDKVTYQTAKVMIMESLFTMKLLESMNL